MSENVSLQKRCTKCGEMKSLDMFGKNRTRKDGLSSWCKTCRSNWKIDIAKVQPPSEKRCTKCGDTKPLEQFYKDKRTTTGVQSECKKCNLELQKIYKATHQEQHREYNNAWRALNRERDRKNQRLWHAKNPGRYKEEKRAWNAKNPRSRKEYNRNWRAKNFQRFQEMQHAYNMANKERKSNYMRNHRLTHRDYYRAAKQLRLARIKGNGGTFTHKELTAMRIAQAGICAYCKMQHDPDALTMDHIIPLYQGDRHEAANICLACGICNSSKGYKTPEQWVYRWYLR